jgi:hypothetical protein
MSQVFLTDPVNLAGSGPGQLYVISGDFVSAANGNEKRSDKLRLNPVRRTWNLGGNTGGRSRSETINPSRLAK